MYKRTRARFVYARPRGVVQGQIFRCATFGGRESKRKKTYKLFRLPSGLSLWPPPYATVWFHGPYATVWFHAASLPCLRLVSSRLATLLRCSSTFAYGSTPAFRTPSYGSTLSLPSLRRVSAGFATFCVPRQRKAEAWNRTLYGCVRPFVGSWLQVLAPEAGVWYTCGQVEASPPRPPQETPP